MNGLNNPFCLINFNFVFTFLIHISHVFNIDFNLEIIKDKKGLEIEGSHTLFRNKRVLAF